MAAHGCTRRVLRVLVVSLLALGLTADAWAWSSGGRGGWDSDEGDRYKERHRERVTKEADKYQEALKAVKQEEEQAVTLLRQGEQKVKAGARSDEVKTKRSLRLVRHKGIKNFQKVDFKCGRLFAGIQKFKADEGDYFTDATKGKVEILLVQVKDLARTNRERIADLYVEVEEPIKALKVLEGIYKSLPANERVSAMDLKARIKALKAQLGIKDDAGAL